MKTSITSHLRFFGRTAAAMFFAMVMMHSSVAGAIGDIGDATQGLLFPMYGTNAPLCSQVTDPLPGGGSGNDVTKYPHIKIAFQFFVSHGYTPAQSAGIVGNLMKESHWEIDPMASDGVAHGIAQWQGGRLQPMYTWVAAWAAEHGDQAGKNSFLGQLNYLIHDLDTTRSEIRDAIKKLNSFAEVADYWNARYEISSDKSSDRRDNARSVLAGAEANGWADNIATAPEDTATCTGGGSPDCQTAAGNAKILCEARKYNGIFYHFGAGHEGYTSFRKGCPIATLDQAAAKSSIGNPGPCATDCSSLVSMALDEAFGLKYMWVVADIVNRSGAAGVQYWKEIPITSAVAGDVVTVGDHHIEVVDHVDIKNKKIYTFGSHRTGTKTSASDAKFGYYDQAWRWTGPTK